MKSLQQEKTYNDLVNRINQINENDQALWGTMDIHKMVNHLVESNRMLLGNAPYQSKLPKLKQLIAKLLYFYFLPLPKGVKAPKRLFPPANSEELSTSKDVLMVQLAELKDQSVDKIWNVEHPYFGKLSTKEWGIFTYKHLDHHLRQFGR